MSFDLSIVIVSFQVCDLLERCLASVLRAQKSLRVQLIVIDNASSDESVSMLRDKFPGIELLVNETNLGFAKACNQGLALAQGRYWMLLNPDTEIPDAHRDALELLVAFMDAHARAGACGPGLFYPDGARQHSAFHFPSLAQIYMDLFPVNWRLRESKWNGRYPFAKYERGEPFPIDHPLGGALVARAGTAKQVGLLDEAFFIYAEEVDWCMRIKRAGWEIWCVPAAHIIHHEARSTRQFREKMFVELWKARLILFHKHYPQLWNTAARRLVRSGMHRAARLAQSQARRGTLGSADLEKRLAAYAAVVALTKAH